MDDQRQRRLDLPPRHGRQADRRHAGCSPLLGRGLHPARRDQPGAARALRRLGVPRHRSAPADRVASPGRRATATRRSTRTTTASSWPPTRTSPSTAPTSPSPRGTRARTRAASSASPADRDARREDAERPDHLRRVRVHREAPIPAPAPARLAAGEEAIVVLQRGPVADPAEAYDACTFQEKFENALAAGYNAAHRQRHHGDASSRRRLLRRRHRRGIVGMCLGHRAFHLLFNDAPDYDADYTPTSRRSEPSARTSRPRRSSTAGATRTSTASGGQPWWTTSPSRRPPRSSTPSGSGTCPCTSSQPTRTRTSPTAPYYAGGMRVFSFGEED